MKITPISGGSANPSASINAIGGSSVSEDRRQAAKAAFLGQTAVKITESDTPVDEQVQQTKLNVRKIKMKTQATPGQYINPAPEAQANPAGPESATQDNVVETKAPEVTQPISPQLAALAKRKREIQVKEIELQAREKALSEKQAQGIAVDRLKAEPLRVLQEAGVTYEQLTEAILADQSGVNPDVQALREEIKALKEGINTQLSERDNQAEQQVLSEIRRETDQLVSGKPDDYEMIGKRQAQKEVVGLIHRVFKEGWEEKGYPPGFVLDTETAANIVEEFLVEDLLPFAQAKKIQSRLTPQQQQVLQSQPQRTQMRTLTNRDVARPVVGDRKTRAMAAFYGTLKK